MKTVLLPTLVLTLTIILGACSGGSNGHTSPEGAAVPPVSLYNDASSTGAGGIDVVDAPGFTFTGDISGEITISTFDSDLTRPLLEEAARLFMHKHPGTVIHVESFSTPMTLIELDGGAVMSEGVDPAVHSAEQRDYVNRINTALMSGRGPDILNMDILPFHRYAISGQLVDLHQFMNNDPDFNLNDYRVNIFDAIATDHGLFKFPLDYIFTVIAFDSYLMTEAQQATLLAQDVFTFDELIAIASPVWEHRSEPIFDMEFTQTFRRMFAMNYVHFIDIEGSRANFTDGVFMDMLNQIQAYEDTGVLLPRWNTPGWEQNFNSRRFYTTMPSVFLFHELLDPSERFIFGGGNTDDNVIAGLWANDHGQVPFTVDSALSINANTNYPELAWAFIKFVSSDAIIDSLQFFSLGRPVHIGAFEARAMREAAGGMWDPDWVDSGLTEAQQVRFDTYVEIVERFTNLLNTYFVTDALLSNLVHTEVESNFFNGTQSAEETAQILQSRIHIFLNE